MIDGFYPFPVTDLAGGESAELRIELKQTFALSHFRPSPRNIEDVWVTDILIGERSLMRKRPESMDIPLEFFFEVNLTFGQEIVPVGVPLTVKLTNHSKAVRNIRLVVFGHALRADC